MLNMNKRVKCHIAFDRSHISNGTYYYTLGGLLSSLFTNELCYDDSQFVTDNIDRNKYDVFEYEIVRVNFNCTPWEDIDEKGNFIDACNKMLVKEGYPEIICMYNTKDLITSAKRVKEEYYKKRPPIAHAILKNSVKYVPCKKHPEPILKEGSKLKLFNMFYKKSILASLDSFGIRKQSCHDFVELTNNCNSFRLSIELENKFVKEFFRVFKELSPEFLSRMFNGELKQIFEAYYIDIDEIMKKILGDGRIIDLDIPTDKFLPKE